MKKAIIAMSGGVDSSVAALLSLQSGLECIGATMKLYDGDDTIAVGSKTCCTSDDTQDARAVAAKLGIPFYVLNFKKEFQEQVIEPFVAAYACGLTPNPCIECNNHLKFERLLDTMYELGFDYIVTGHYARIELDESNGRWLLKKARDLTKDQSYVLYKLSQEQLSHIRFPLGDYAKTDVRMLAEKNGFVNSQKQESQDICFIPDGDYAAFIERYTSQIYPPGPFKDLQGHVLGEHKGIIRYTVGQRKGLGLALPRPMYVCKKDVVNNEVILSYKEDLICKEVFAEQMNWIAIEAPSEPFHVKARLRYNQPEQPATVYPAGIDKVRVVFDVAVSTPAAKGQALVLYDGDTVVGGGTIV